MLIDIISNCCLFYFAFVFFIVLKTPSFKIGEYEMRDELGVILLRSNADSFLEFLSSIL